MLCFSCALAYERKLFNNDPKELAFVSRGFNKWNRASEKFTAHERSQLHFDACSKLRNREKKPINALLSSETEKSQGVARKALDTMFSSVRYLLRQGFPLRGDDHNDGAFYQLVKERCRDFPEVESWMKRKNNWMSDTIQNEILQQIGHSIQTVITDEARQSEFFGITADGTTDCAGQEQFSITLQYVTSELTVKSMFLGFYNPPATDGETLHKVIVDVFQRLNLSLEKIQGFCFDGASNMSGMLKGVQARLKENCPHGVFVHCANHSLDLCLQEVGREIPLLADALRFVKDAANLIRESPKRKSQFQNLFRSGEAVILTSLCATRWCVRASAFKRVLHVYEELLQLLGDLSEDRSVRADTRARMRGLLHQANSSSTYFGIYISDTIFSPCEDLAKALQANSITAHGATEAASNLQKFLIGKRRDDLVDQVIEFCEEKVRDLNLQAPRQHRSTRVQSNSFPIRTEWRRQYLEALDLVTNEINRRFRQPGMRIAAKREQV